MMLMQNFGVTSKEHYSMLWYFLEWSTIIPELQIGQNLSLREVDHIFPFQS